MQKRNFHVLSLITHIIIKSAISRANTQITHPVAT